MDHQTACQSSSQSANQQASKLANQKANKPATKPNNSATNQAASHPGRQAANHKSDQKKIAKCNPDGLPGGTRTTLLGASGLPNQDVLKCAKIGSVQLLA